jgi:hypothetical protein
MARKRSDMENLRGILAALLGGVAGVLASKALQHFGVKPVVAAGGVAIVGGAIAAFSGNDDLQAAGGGAAAAATSCLVQLWVDAGLLGLKRAEPSSAPAPSHETVNAAFDRALASFHADMQEPEAA